jgi:hypothetical protein
MHCLRANQLPALLIFLPCNSGLLPWKLVPYPLETLYLLFALTEMNEEQLFEFCLISDELLMNSLMS